MPLEDIPSIRFLVVEDHGFQRWLIVNLLREMGATSVQSAPDGAAALNLLSAPDQAVDVVVSDLDMPGMDGMELVRHIAKAAHPAKLVIVSSLDRSLMATVETMARAYGIELLASIQKPLTAKKLQAAFGARPPGPRTAESAPPAPMAFGLTEVDWALRHGQFETYYQPKVELLTSAVRGAEALVRWRHPEHGVLSPSLFMPLVESGGLVDELTRQVTGAACARCVEWRRAGYLTNVSVNLSPSSLGDVTLAERMTRIAAESGLEPEHLLFEITESAATKEAGPELENLSRLRMRGFGLSIDDFGTGYSSMERLARIPFTELKIDQGFVRNAVTQDASRAMVESSLELARKLGITAVAEGVQSKAEWTLVLGLGCRLAQGHYVAEPMSAEEFARWAKARPKAANGA